MVRWGMHPTLVVLKNSKTVSVARPSHSSLTEGVRGRLHSCPPNLLPHPSGLRGPRPEPFEQVVTLLGLAAGAPPALARVRLFYPQQVGPCRHMTS